MRTLLLSLALSVPILAAIGDNAPSVPSTYVAAHPRLPYPDNAFLQSICLNGSSASVGDACGATMVSRYRVQAETYSAVSVSAGANYNIRYLLIAYLATKWGAANGHGPVNSTYLTKIKQFKNWTSLTYDTGWGVSMAYDWIYADICTSDGGTVTNSVCSASTTLTGLRTIADTLLINQKNSWNNNSCSPMNDQCYITFATSPWMTIASAFYDPNDAANAATFLAHLRIAMDVELNMSLPIWKKLAGGYDYCPNASTDADFLCGAGWPDGWNDYTNLTGGVFHSMIHGMLSWAYASGQSALVGGVPQFFANNGWIKNYAYWMMYQVRPDFVIEPISSVSRPHFNTEYGNGLAVGDTQGGTKSELSGMIDALAGIYNDPTIRGWSRLVDWSQNSQTVLTPDGFEPSAWPYYTPDGSGKPANTNRSVLSPVRNFPVWGTVFLKTGFGESDTSMTMRYGDSFWTHPNSDTGAFTIYNRGPLAIRSGGYRPGSESFLQFYNSTNIAQNTLTIGDPADRYTDENYLLCSAFYLACDAGAPNGDVTVIAPNDSGQRPLGSTRGNTFLPGVQQAPADLPRWQRSREYYHTGNLIAFAVHQGQYTYGAIDQTAAYNNYYSMNPHTGPNIANQANSSNRSYRATKAIRHFLWIPRGTAAYVIIYDQVNTKSATFKKNWLLHSINQPVIPNPAFPSYANSYTISRTELVTTTYNNSPKWPLPWGGSMAFCPGGCISSSLQYQYNGKLYGFAPWPTGGSLTTVGGPGHEFSITDATTGIETNYNQCRYGQCGSEFGSTAGSVAGPWTITSSSNDVLCVGVNGAACTNLTLTAGAGRTCAQVASNLNTLFASNSIAATASCEGMVSPLSYIAIRSNNNTRTSCADGNPPSATCSGVVIGASNGTATFGFSVGAFCAANYFGLGSTICTTHASAPGFDEGYEAIGGLNGFVHPNPLKGPQQPGSWRIVGWTGASGTNANNISDQFINVMLATSATDTNVVSTAPVTTQVTLNGQAALQTDWKDNANGCAYRAVFYVDGVGGTVTATGAGCAVPIT